MGKEEKKKWAKEDFIKAWLLHQGSPGDGHYCEEPNAAWAAFFKEMAGACLGDCQLVIKEKDLSLRLGITSRYMKDAGWNAPKYPKRPTAKAVDDSSIDSIMTKLLSDGVEGVKKAPKKD
jgi:hypothetical protein